MIELEARLTDAALEMADRMIGGSFTRGGNTKKRVYAATTRDVGPLMRMLSRTIDALGTAQENGVDGLPPSMMRWAGTSYSAPAPRSPALPNLQRRIRWYAPPIAG